MLMRDWYEAVASDSWPWAASYRRVGVVVCDIWLNILASQKRKKGFLSSRLPSRPWLSAGTCLLQKTKRLKDALRLVEELGERSGAAVGS